ncbi:prevent-host-death family protein [Mycobacteroides chelonae]|uniref:type II toxin-antitoxin system Phd/YefM family antitoxin n=1 Tax=Mycobacteroides chelonae TaxID=1774 RepID=UPI00091608ED|nr:type II toxin-antitoxin system Phd/YefM family antitoxin [Mycobacteroides chelonae]OHT95586.1 prevent-host-death family protein [Mycobacteroides chelonae]
MQEIGVRELRQNASQYLARVEAGEELGVTNNGRLVARLVPVRAADRSREALIAAGVLVPASRPQNLLDIVPTPTEPGQPSLSSILEEMRDER